MKTRLLFVATYLLVVRLAIGADSPLVIHEWGTFTSLQDEGGRPIGGINTEDEPLPAFVHRLAGNVLLSATEAPPHFFQGAPSCHPDVTMRLETPVIYFHPPKDWEKRAFDVEVEFRGGWLTEFYPAAEAVAPGFDASAPERVFTRDERMWITQFGHLKPEASGRLRWLGVTLGDKGKIPPTTEKVWLAPRAVKAATVRAAGGECEQYLFYRGVGCMESSLRLARNAEPDTLAIRQNGAALGLPDLEKRIAAAWLLEVRPDGSCAFRPLGALDFQQKPELATAASFRPEDFAPANLPRLQAGMRAALVASGLFADEADALLNTWEISYFQSPGLRLFYLCPRALIDHLLPLRISIPSDVTRVMIGRIEIVTPAQRALLKEIAAGPAPDLSAMRGVTGDSQSDFFKNPANLANFSAVLHGTAPLKVLGLKVPKLYETYLQLGRFRNALILDEQKRRPTPALDEFISKNGFAAYSIQ